MIHRLTGGETVSIDMRFDDALEQAKDEERKPNLLLGNGFSIAWSSNFGYSSLYDKADLDLHTDKDELFGVFGSWDFEYAIEHLERAAEIEELYTAAPQLAATYRSDADEIRKGLATTIAAVHDPHNASEIDPESTKSAQDFLANFGQVFTLNYDLLLYWVVNKDEGGGAPRSDGFMWAKANGKGPLIWKPTAPAKVHYLHGALHLYENEDFSTEKLKYQGRGSMIEDVKVRIRARSYPLIVTEGSSQKKRTRINRSPYLRQQLLDFQSLKGSLFIHGFSFSKGDDHILDALASADCAVDTLYVSTFGAAAKERARAGSVADRRKENGGRQLNVVFYDAKSAYIWR